MPSTPPSRQPIATRGPWTPKPIHHRYLLALLEALEDNGNTSDRQMAKVLDVRHESISRWKRRSPEFVAWVAAQVDAITNIKGAQILGRCANLALRGSVDHMKLYFTVTGKIGGDDRANAPGGMQFNGPTVVNLAVPRPGDAPVHASQKMVGEPA